MPSGTHTCRQIMNELRSESLKNTEDSPFPFQVFSLTPLYTGLKCIPAVTAVCYGFLAKACQEIKLPKLPRFMK